MDFETLIGKLDSGARSLLEQAVAAASSRSHYSVDIEHLLLQVLSNDSDSGQAILSVGGCQPAVLTTQLQAVLEHLKTGNPGLPKFAPEITRVLFDAWMTATTDYQCTRIQTAHLLLALVDSQTVRLRLGQLASEWQKLDAALIKSEFGQLLSGAALAGQHPDANSISAPASPGGGTHLNQYTINLTERARSGKIDSIIGRDHEVRQIIDILSRKKQNNPILTGEPGVGKTAVAEGLALKIINGDVPESLRNVQLLSLDMGLLQAGAGVKGEFENRLKGVIKDVQSAPVPVILFIDEAHTLIGAGNQAGAGDAANLLKPALARGELRTIAATTWAEYKKYFESDAALTRRFQVVKVEEPTSATAIQMLRHIAPGLESHHGVTILDSAIAAAVHLSHRYIAGRQLPDKCVSLLDTACARVALSLGAVPAAVEKPRAELAALDQEIDRLSQEVAAGHRHDQAISHLQLERAARQSMLDSACQRWQKEKTLTEEIRQQLDILSADLTEAEREQQQARLIARRSSLEQLQCGHPLVFECVNEDVIAQVVADWTGIPVGKMQRDQVASVLSLQQAMEERVIGQTHALSLIAKAIRTSRAGLSDPGRPLGVFMLVGPSGVGKTETALALAEQLYGSDRLITTINMSEFKEEHKVSMLLGSPPGYVGYGEGGVLTEAVRRNPYSVLLLDEMEKAHPGVHDIFYQVFDKGTLKDGQGRDIDFKNTLIMMTSNTASEEIAQLCADPDTAPEGDELLQALAPVLRKSYKPAFLGRINVIPYLPLSPDNLTAITRLQLDKIARRLRSSYQSDLVCPDSFLTWVVDRCQQGDVGARQIDLLLTNTFLPMLSEKILERLAQGKSVGDVNVSVDKNNTLKIRFSDKNKNNKRALKNTKKTTTA